MDRKGYDLQTKCKIPKIASSARKAESAVKYLKCYLAAWKAGLDKENKAEKIIYKEIKSLVTKVETDYKLFKKNPIDFYKKLGNNLQSFITQMVNPDAKFKDSGSKVKEAGADIIKKINENIGDELLKISKMAAAERAKAEKISKEI